MFKQPLCTYCGMEGHLAAACTWKTSLIQCDDGIHLIDLRKGFSDFYGRVLRRHPDGLLVSVRKATAAEIVIASLRAAAISSRERTADAAPADVPRVSIDVAVNRFEGPAMHWAPDQSERSLGMVEPKQAESSQGERIIQTAPERIYLIVGTECPRDVDFSELTEVSWCENDIDDGIEYVRADKAGAALARVAELEQERDAANSRLHEVATACATAEQQRDAALARLAELEQEPVGVMRASSEAGVAPYADIWPRLEPGMQLYAAPVAQAGQVPELDQLYSMLGAEDQVDAARKIAELVGCRLSRNALTEAQMRRLYENSTEAENERLGFAAFARLMRRAEAVHQIAAAPPQGGATDE